MSDATPDQPVPELIITADAASGPATLSNFFDGCAPIFNSAMTDRADNRAFSASLKGVQLGTLVLSEVSMRGGDYHYQRDAQLIAATGLDLMFVQVITGGSDKRLVAGEEIVSKPGDVFIADLTRTMQTQTQDCSNFSFVVPRALFGLREAELDRFHDRFLPGEGFASKILRNHIQSIWTERQSIGAGDIPGLSAATAGLIGGLLSHDPAQLPDDPAFASPKYLQICQYIDQNLGAQDLDPDHLARRFSLSRAALYRLFAETDGVANYIRERRLRHAFRQLTSTERLNVSAVGFASGFTNVSSFIRAFKSKFGLTPGDAVGQASLRMASPQARAQTLEGSLLRSWIEHADRAGVLP